MSSKDSVIIKDSDEIALFNALHKYMNKYGKKRIFRVLFRWLEGELDE